MTRNRAEAPLLRCAPGTAKPGARTPSHLIRSGSQRLGWFALLIACPPVALVLIDSLLLALGKPTLSGDPDLALRARTALAALSVTMFGVSRIRRLTPDRVLLAGLCYEVAGALLLSLRSYWGDVAVLQQGDMITPVVVWIAIFPLIVPAAPVSSAVAASAAAATGPLVHALWLRHTGSPTGALDLARIFTPLMLGAGLNVAASFLVQGLGRKVAAAEACSRELGSYRLVERLGSGGMGEVWRAEHRMLARPVAIKLILPELLVSEKPDDRSSIVARFEREAQATAELHSPHTVSIFDYGVSEDGTLYYVMELLGGIDLQTLVETFGPLPPERVVHLLAQAADSLAEAHAHGLIHRDVKPANIYVSRVGLTYDVVKVLDFGLVARSKKPDAHLTGDGFIVGTPKYISPEQVAGWHLDGRADVYALGAVGYWLLTGTAPFQSEEPGELLADHLRTPVEPPGVRLGRPVPEQLERLLLRCLAKEPWMRPADGSSLLQELRECGVEGWSELEARRWWEANLEEFSVPTPRGRSMRRSTVRAVARPVASRPVASRPTA